jgi:hypothetical protein
MIEQRGLGKKTVELAQPRPSRIRREPVQSRESERLAQNAWWDSREWEVRFAVIGITFFALAISAVVIDVGELLSR